MAVTVLFSGGVDSLCVARWAQARFSDVHGVYYCVGQKYAARESSQATELAKKIHLPFNIQAALILREDPVTARVELRNLFFIELAGLGSDAVCYGELLAEEPTDKRPVFRRRLQTLLRSQRETPFHIYAPFAKYTKSQMIREYIRQYGTEFLTDSVACFDADGACGACMSCFNRWLAWEENNLSLESYRVHPAQAMLERLQTMHRNKGARDWNAVSLGRVWARRRWLIECRRQLNRYCYRQHGVSAWRYAHAS